MSKQHYLFRPDDEELWKQFRKDCIDKEISIKQGLEIAINNFCNMCENER